MNGFCSPLLHNQLNRLGISSIGIAKGASFKDMVALKCKPAIGDGINKIIIGKIAEANNLTGTIDVADFNNAHKLGSGKDMVDRLTKLIVIFENPALDFSKNVLKGTIFSAMPMNT